LSTLIATPEVLIHFRNLVVDGFPIIAWVNKGKTVYLKEIPYQKIKDLFQHIDLSFIDDILPVHKRCKQHSSALVKVHLLEELMAYRSLNAVVRPLRKDKKFAEVLGFDTKVLPSYPVALNVKKRINKKLAQLKNYPLKTFDGLLDKVAGMIAGNKYLRRKYGLPYELKKGIHELFNLFDVRRSIVDPDAKMGYCSAKDLYYLGYKGQLVCDVRRGLPMHILIGPANTHDGQMLPEVLKGLERIREMIDVKLKEDKRYKVAKEGRLTVRNVYLDKAYVGKECREAVAKMGGRACLSEEKVSKKVRKRWNRVRIEVEHVISRINEYGGLGAIKVRGLERVQIQGHIAVCALLVVAIKAYKSGRIEEIRCPTTL